MKVCSLFVFQEQSEVPNNKSNRLSICYNIQVSMGARKLL
jgi:hypothetical protein